MQSKNIIAANPQGKASLSLLDDIHKFKTVNAKAKDIPEWLADYFTSLLVLSASFNFKPVINNIYYLYIDNKNWKLSLISPLEWNNCPYIYFAECKLHEDRSWSIKPCNDWNDNQKLVAQIQSMKEDFVNSLNTDQPILESLPFFVEQLPYYQRLSAFALAHSLKQSLQLKLGLDESEQVKCIQVLNYADEINVLRLSSDNSAN